MVVLNECSSASSNVAEEHSGSAFFSSNKKLDVIQIMVDNEDEVSIIDSHIKGSLSSWYSAFGCILFLMSLILCRGLEKVKTDMDDPHNTLLGQFGHCSQDLINLLLSGRATSNVIDGEISLGDSGLSVKGINKKANIGYLTHLEALRYCTVGDFYKIPQYPIWIVGSSSHFTVFFSLDSKINEESKSEKLLSSLQRCFRSIDSQECGYISSDKLRHTLELIVKDCNSNFDTSILTGILNSDIDLARLRGKIQLEDNIILWSSFWENISKLINGATLDSLFTLDVEPVRERSDSEIARSLQIEYDNEEKKQSHNDQIDDVNGFMGEKSDLQIAQELQEKWDSDLTPTTSNALVPLFSEPKEESESFIGKRNSDTNSIDAHMVAKRSQIHRADSIANSESTSFVVYHFNGLESNSKKARLSKFRLFVR